MKGAALLLLLVLPVLMGCRWDSPSAPLEELTEQARQYTTRDVLSPLEARAVLQGSPRVLPESLGQAVSLEDHHWFEVALPPCPNERGCVLLVPFPSFDEVDLWLYAGSTLLTHQGQGDGRVVDPQSADPRFAFALPPGEGQTAVLRIRTGGFLAFSLRWATASDYARNLSAFQLWYGILFGSLLILALYNFFVYLGLRDRSFLLYSAYICSIALFLAIFTGFASLYLWPSRPGLSNTMMILAPCLSIIFGLSFCLSFLRKARPGRFLAGFSRAQLALAAVLIGFALLGLPYEPLVRVTAVLAYVTLFTYLLLALRAWQGGMREARYLLFAFSSFFIGMVFHQLHIMALVPSNLFTRHASEMGALLEATLLSFALADQINSLNREKRRLESEALDAQLTFSRQLVQAQESERESVSRALHDSVGHGLLVVKNYLDQGGGAGRAPELARYCGEMLDTVRDLSHALHPHILERLDLGSALEAAMTQALGSSSLRWTCVADDSDARLNPEQRLALYRVAQEALSNTLKHARANEIILVFTCGDEEATLRFKDDGQGFDPDETAEGIGLVNMRGRLELVGGQLALKTAPGAGCELRFTVPLDPEP